MLGGGFLTFVALGHGCSAVVGLMRSAKVAAAALAAIVLFSSIAQACTRVVYLGPESRILTGRTFDWRLPINSNLWVFPRGMDRTGVAGPRSVKWTSRYGSVAVSGYDVSTVDGMNEAGLAANLLWQVESEYPADDGAAPRMSVSVWAQYFLDNFATVAEAVAFVEAHPFDVATGDVPGQPGRLTTVHLSLSDATGDSAILEWMGGEQRIHHGRDYRVMTNDPRFDQQLAIAKYWQNVNPLEFLPGTNRAADRFVRARFYVDAVAQSDDPRVAAAAVFSVIRNVSVPYGVSVPDAPNLSTTRWRIVADHKDKLFYVESAVSPNVFWVDFSRLNFSAGAAVRKLDLGIDMAALQSGEASENFIDATPFEFEPA